MNRSRLHWALIAGTAAAVGVGTALSMRALTELVDATLPDARGIASFNRPGTIKRTSKTAAKCWPIPIKTATIAS